MKKILIMLLFCGSLFVQAQKSTQIDTVNFQEDLKDIIQEKTDTQKDTIIYNKSTAISTERVFVDDIKKKYNTKEFEYKEDTSVKKEKKPSKPSNFSFLSFFSGFMTTIFPFLLGAFVIFVILKSVLGIDANFWKSKNKARVQAKQLVFEEKDINDIDLDELLQKAIHQNDYRLAIRYYYLITLKKLANKKLIEYHKDKTNSEYLFEIENSQTKNHFAYLSYVYSYVWYGEFPIDQNSFKIAQNKYQSFLNSLI